jgi:hypothetical protein
VRFIGSFSAGTPPNFLAGNPICIAPSAVFLGIGTLLVRLSRLFSLDLFSFWGTQSEIRLFPGICLLVTHEPLAVKDQSPKERSPRFPVMKFLTSWLFPMECLNECFHSPSGHLSTTAHHRLAGSGLRTPLPAFRLTPEWSRSMSWTRCQPHDPAASRPSRIPAPLLGLHPSGS